MPGLRFAELLCAGGCCSPRRPTRSTHPATSSCGGSCCGSRESLHPQPWPSMSDTLRKESAFAKEAHKSKKEALLRRAPRKTNAAKKDDAQWRCGRRQPTARLLAPLAFVAPLPRPPLQLLFCHLAGLLQLAPSDSVGFSNCRQCLFLCLRDWGSLKLCGVGWPFAEALRSG